MPINSKYLFVASMDVDPDKEALFNEVYDTEHIPNLLKVPGVHAVTRIKGEPFAVSIGGAELQVAHTGPRYSALYEIEGPHVLVSPAWAQAVELGRFVFLDQVGFNGESWLLARCFELLRRDGQSRSAVGREREFVRVMAIVG